MIYDASEDTHGSIDVVLRYAMPNVNAVYERDRIEATKWAGDYPVCAYCGRSAGPFAVHHEPPRSKGSLLLKTPMGRFVVKPALLLLCRECHQDRHDRGLLTIDWRFDNTELERMWLEGELFARGYDEHDPRLYEYGAIVMRGRLGERHIREI